MARGCHPSTSGRPTSDTSGCPATRGRPTTSPHCDHTIASGVHLVAHHATLLASPREEPWCVARVRNIAYQPRGKLLGLPASGGSNLLSLPASGQFCLAYRLRGHLATLLWVPCQSVWVVVCYLSESCGCSAFAMQMTCTEKGQWEEKHQAKGTVNAGRGSSDQGQRTSRPGRAREQSIQADMSFRAVRAELHCRQERQGRQGTGPGNQQAAGPGDSGAEGQGTSRRQLGEIHTHMIKGR